tara:strand:+ start:1551 stop:1727 length:177 start_codon:yes stop_codon:yes gene_type:complete
MKAYGKKRKDGGCCPGHDKYPSERYSCTTASSRRVRDQRRKTSARQQAARDIEKEILF